jgi:hypothetical protein
MGYFGGDGDKVFFGDPLFYANTVTATICQGETYVFPDGSTSTQSGTHSSQFFSANGCDSIINTLLTVTPVDTAVIHGLTSLTSSATSASFQWVDCNSGYAWINGQAAAMFQPGISGSYAVIVSQNGCTDTSDCHTLTLTGLSTITEPGIGVYPNPVTNELNLKSVIRFELAEIIISDAFGRTCLNINAMFNTDLKLDVSTLSPGFYSLVIKSVNSKEYRTKFLK